jgi:hypothetical protein
MLVLEELPATNSVAVIRLKFMTFGITTAFHVSILN